MRHEKLLPLKPVEGKNTTHLSVEVYYSKGGMNFATYKDEPRGIYLSAGPVSIERRDGMEIRGFAAFSGVKTLLEGSQRLNQKKVDSWFALVKVELLNKKGQAHDLVVSVLAKHGLELTEELPADTAPVPRSMAEVVLANG